MIYFLLVGHTGNSVDQKFSILTQELKKSEIKTLEELIDLILNSPICPKPDVKILSYIWDWKCFISNNLTDKKLENHSFYNAFWFVKEDGVTKMRVKPLPQDTEWLPPTGMRIIKSDIKFEPVPCADFRIENLYLDKVVHDLQRYFSRMPTQIRVNVARSWFRLKESLENLPKKRKFLPPMKIVDLPKLEPELTPTLPDEYAFVLDEMEEVPQLVGHICEMGLFDNNVKVGSDVVVYTRSKIGRPWTGRIVEILPNKRFVINWYEREGKSLKFRSMKQGKSDLYTSELENSSVMFWDMSTHKSERSFHLTSSWMDKIIKEYKLCDDKDVP